MAHPSFSSFVLSLAYIALVLIPLVHCSPTAHRLDYAAPLHHKRAQEWEVDAHPHHVFNSSVKLGKRDNSPALRIMPLGASITWGLQSSTGNGYRKPLRDQLRYEGWEVDMVGSKSNGDMVDNDVEAHSGDIIDEVKTAAQSSIAYKANVVLINAGTNDCTRSIDLGNAGARMRSLIESIMGSDGWDRTTFILSTLIPSGDGTTEANRGTVNDQYRDLVEAMQGEGKKVVLADMDPPAPALGHGWMVYPTDYADTIHPNDEGYRMMAYVWWKAIQVASDVGYLEDAYDVDLSGGSQTCEKELGDGVYAGGLTQRGSGIDDGIYYHSSQEMGIILTVTSDYDRDQWFWARLFSRDRDDLLGWFNLSDGSVIYGTWRNDGDGTFTKIGDTSTGNGCIPRGVVFIDLNADGLDDFACISPNGEVYAAINQGDGTDTTPPTFKGVGKIMAAKDGYEQSHVRLADIDGDGRADYCTLEDSGDISCWRNGGIGDTPDYWQALDTVFTGKGMGDLNGVRFEDLNGDGRDDWMWVGDVGDTYTWTNSRSCINGITDHGVTPSWRQAFWHGESSGPTHAGMGAFGTGGFRDRVHFARVYGTAQDFGLLGRQDYVFMQHSETDEGKHQFDIRVWKNLGSGSTKLKADGDRYCNMLGHDDGREDYVWILSKGEMRVYENQGYKSVSDDGPNFWGPNYVIWDPTTQAIGKYLDRRDLHLTDWDGDGACDIVWTDPDNTNHVQLWRNTVKETGSIGWAYDADPASSLYCPETRGIGFFDRPVQFHDITGNGKGDYMCIEKDGRVWGFVHNDAGGWDYMDQIKFSEGKDRANLQWADVNGDGRADMLWVNKFNGDTDVWYNMGMKDVSGSRFWWDPVGTKYLGAVSGSCTYFPDLDGDGRADMHGITNSFTNTAETWFNRCGSADSQGDDPDGVHDPELPVMPSDGSGGGGGGGAPGSDCTSGTGSGKLEELCAFACKYGYCPDPPCTCLTWGTALTPPTPGVTVGYPLDDEGAEFYDLCQYTCARDYCPDDACTTTPKILNSHIRVPTQEECDADPSRDSISSWSCHFNQCDSCCDGATTSPFDRWNEVSAGDALFTGTAWCQTINETIGFPDWLIDEPAQIGWGLGGNNTPTDYPCELIAINDCDAPVDCGQSDFVAVDLVLISFSNIHNFYYNMHAAIGDAKTEFVDPAKKVSDTFIREKPDPLALIEKAMGIFDFFLMVSGAGVWEKILSAEAAELLKDTTEKVESLVSSIGTTLDTFKFLGDDLQDDLADALSDAVGDTDDKKLEDMCKTISSFTQDAISNYAKYIFNCADDFGQAELNDICSGGVFLRDPLGLAQLSQDDLKAAYHDAMMAVMIQMAWRTEDNQYPVLIVAEGEATGNPLQYWMTDDDADANRVYDSTTDYTVWLVGSTSPQYAGTVFDGTFIQLKGADKIRDADDDYRDITFEDIALSALWGWLNNDKKNPYDVGTNSDFSSDSAGANLVPMGRGAKSAGVFNFPACGADLIKDNYAWRWEFWSAEQVDRGDPCGWWPCCNEGYLTD